MTFFNNVSNFLMFSKKDGGNEGAKREAKCHSDCIH